MKKVISAKTVKAPIKAKAKRKYTKRMDWSKIKVTDTPVFETCFDVRYSRSGTNPYLTPLLNEVKKMTANKLISLSIPLTVCGTLKEAQSLFKTVTRALKDTAGYESWYMGSKSLTNDKKAYIGFRIFRLK